MISCTATVTIRFAVMLLNFDRGGFNVIPNNTNINTEKITITEIKTKAILHKLTTTITANL